MMTGQYTKVGIGLAVAAACMHGASDARAEHYYSQYGSPTYVSYAPARTIAYVQPSYVRHAPAYTPARIVYQSPRRHYGHGGHHVARYRYVRRAYRPHAYYSSGYGHHYRGNSHHYYNRPHYKSKHFSVGIGGFGFSYTKTKHHGRSQRSFGFSLGRGHNGRGGGHAGFSHRRHR